MASMVDMSVRCKRPSPGFLRSLAFVSACFLGSAALAQAPTAQLPAEEIADQWKQASSSHDGARNAILQDVERVDHAGPYRADWGSLSGWNVPDWYKDAKFGISYIVAFTRFLPLTASGTRA